MEWKVKRRQDGSRYIVRRPIRYDVNKKNNDKIVPDPTITTEDETLSEVKTGKYWSKIERRRHIERLKERKSLRLPDPLEKCKKIQNAQASNISSYPVNMTDTASHTPLFKNKKTVKKRTEPELVPVSSTECNPSVEIFSVTTV